MVNGDGGSILDVFETVTHELDAAKPASHTDDPTPDIMLLKHAENHHSGSSFPIVVFGFVDDSFVFDASRKAVVIGAYISLVFFESFEKGFDILATLYVTVAYAVATAAVFDNLFEEYKRHGRDNAVSEGKGRGGHRGNYM